MAPPFSHLTRDGADIQLGLLCFLPTLLLDAAFMGPDYSSTPEQARDTMRLFIKPDLLARLQVRGGGCTGCASGRKTDPAAGTQRVPLLAPHVSTAPSAGRPEHDQGGGPGRQCSYSSSSSVRGRTAGDVAGRAVSGCTGGFIAGPCGDFGSPPRRRRSNP